MARSVPSEKRSLFLQEIDSETQRSAGYIISDEMVNTARQMGIETNVSVLPHSTAFSSRFPSNRFSSWLWIEAERMKQPAFRLFRWSLAGVLQELSLVTRNLPSSDTGFERLRERMLGQWPILGRAEERLLEPYFPTRRFHRDWYHPNNAAIVLVGDIDEYVLPILEQAFSFWKPYHLPEHVKSGPRERSLQPTIVRELESRKVLVGWVPEETETQNVLSPTQLLFSNMFLDSYRKLGIQSATNISAMMDESGAWMVSGEPGERQTLASVQSSLAQAAHNLWDNASNMKQEQFDGFIRGILRKQQLGVGNQRRRRW